MDFLKVGYFSCKEFSELVMKKNLKTYIDFQRNNPNTVFLYFDYNLSKGNNYSFYCYRLNQKFMDMVELMEIEEAEPNIFRKFCSSADLITKLNFTIENDVFSFSNTLSEQAQKEKESEELYKTYLEKNNLYNRMYNLNNIVTI
jgi:hypothetical protein